MLEPNLPPNQKVASFSFAPYHIGHSPLEKKFPTPEQIQSDLELIARHTEGLRTYSSREGLDKAHEFIQQKGLDLIQGAWLTHNDSIEGRLANHHEISALIKAANEHPDTVKRVIVGNEVLLRGDMEVEPLIQYIRTVRNAIDQPVSYADVWSLYLKHPELIDEVDFITIHILPYWEDEPISARDAPSHLLNIIEQVKKEAKSLGINKPILIGETGWPAQGRQRGQAVPSPENQAFYIREVVKLAEQHHIDYNLVEAFNQAWKSKLEGKVGAHWGMFDANRNAVFSLSGPVYNNPNWLQELIPGLALALLFFTLHARHFRGLSHRQSWALTGLFCLVFALWGQYAWNESADSVQMVSSWAWSLPLMAIGGITVWVQTRFCLFAFARKVAPRVWTVSLVHGLALLIALFLTIQMGLYSRYLEFQTDWLLPLALGGLATWFVQRKQSKQHFPGLATSTMTRLAVVAFTGCAIWLLVGEARSYMYGRDFQLAHPQLMDSVFYAAFYTVTNTQLWAWLGLLLLLSLTFARLKAKPMMQ